MDIASKSSHEVNPVLLVVLDGWGYSENTEYNAIHSADTPSWDAMWAECPRLLLAASGIEVGLPSTQMGNSEVGHMHMGAGRVIAQDFTRIMDAIEDGSFHENEVLRRNFTEAAQNGRAIHLAGLLSPGGVHGHEDHMIAAMELAADCGVKRLFLHLFLDGRDTLPKSAAESVHRVKYEAERIGLGRIATMVGRYYAMDRNNNWSRTAKSWGLIMQGKADHTCKEPLLALDEAYARGESDEFVKATVITSLGFPYEPVQDKDVLVFLNFRADRIRQLASACSAPSFTGFDRGRTVHPKCISMTLYEKNMPLEVIFPPKDLGNVFGEVLSEHKLRQLRIAETEKYAHVTYFFNGGRESSFVGENRILVPSPHVATYDMKPDMSAAKITEKLIGAMRLKRYDAIICNYANADMVGHTGDLEATIRAVEVLDTCIGQLRLACNDCGVDLIITADHGNAEQLRTYTNEKTPGQNHTAHTSNPVPFVYSGRSAEISSVQGSLIDVAPTMLYLMGLPIPQEMTGTPLLRLTGDMCNTQLEAS
ncbi:MAG: 2,3-bisphosphoglycerate-independent phosphoglycerate mutase [Candidatus Porifericomitaceae bacterium WSBS_2022_MAG_OTU9]